MTPKPKTLEQEGMTDIYVCRKWGWKMDVICWGHQCLTCSPPAHKPLPPEAQIRVKEEK